MLIVLTGIVDDTVIACNCDPVFVAQVSDLAHQIFFAVKGAVHGTAPGGIVAKSHVGLQIQHGILQLCFFQIFHIGFGREPA